MMTPEKSNQSKAESKSCEAQNKTIVLIGITQSY
jgi:hypothetical protein